MILAASDRGFAQTAINASFIPTGASIYVEEMKEDLDGYIRAEIVKKKLALNVVVSREDAHVVLTGDAATTKRSWSEGWLTTQKDHATGSAMIIDRKTGRMLWAGEAGDRDMWWGDLARGGPRKVAGRLVDQIKKAIRAVPPGSLPAPPPLSAAERQLAAAPIPAAPAPGPDTIVTSAPAAPAVFTNEDVVKLLSAAVGDDVVIAKIKSSSCRFQLDTDSIIALKKGGASDRVIAAMIEASK
jgi:hypothetical protein